MAADLEFVASLVSAPEGLSSTEAIARSFKQHRQSTERQPRQVRGTPSCGTRRAQQQQFRERQEQDARLQQYQQPGSRSTAAALHCQACNCWVPPQPADNWQQHVKGIRHRRQLVSMRLTGQLGNMTVSLFEALPGWPRGQPSEQAPAADRAAGNSAGLSQRVQHMRATALKELIHHAAVSGAYQRLSERFSEERLSGAWVFICGYLAQHLQGGRLSISTASPAHIVSLAHLEALHSIKDWTVQVYLRLGQEGPAMAAAVCVLLEALRSHPHLQRLSLGLSLVSGQLHAPEPAPAAPDVEAAQQPSPPNAALLPTAPEVHALLTKILKAVKRFLATNTSVRQLNVCCQGGNLLPEWQCDIAVAAAEAPKAQRLAFLLACGQKSKRQTPLAILPNQVARTILEMAIPHQQPCTITFEPLA
eukprot:jgi/Astpho2/3182/Aster-x1129